MSAGNIIHYYLLQLVASPAYTYTIGRVSVSPSPPLQVPAVGRHSNIIPLSTYEDSEAAVVLRDTRRAARTRDAVCPPEVSRSCMRVRRCPVTSSAADVRVSQES